MAGDLGVDGVAFHGNDWIKDESPRYARVTGVKNAGRDEVRVTLRTVDGRDVHIEGETIVSACMKGGTHAEFAPALQQTAFWTLRRRIWRTAQPIRTMSPQRRR